jgi:hypothetical protein
VSPGTAACSRARQERTMSLGRRVCKWNGNDRCLDLQRRNAFCVHTSRWQMRVNCDVLRNAKYTASAAAVSNHLASGKHMMPVRFCALPSCLSPPKCTNRMCPATRQQVHLEQIQAKLQDALNSIGILQSSVRQIDLDLRVESVLMLSAVQHKHRHAGVNLMGGGE